jgi:hypothetical protein
MASDQATPCSSLGVKKYKMHLILNYMKISMQVRVNPVYVQQLMHIFATNEAGRYNKMI